MLWLILIGVLYFVVCAVVILFFCGAHVGGED